MADKVYCEKCLFFVKGENITFSFGPPDYIKEACLSPDNAEDNYKEEKTVLKSIPKVINEFNDCKWYQAKDGDGSSSGDSSSTSSSSP